MTANGQPTYDYNEKDPTFLQDLRDSRLAVDVVSQWLAGAGYPVVVRPTFERPDVALKADYADSGDLEVLMRVEVKHRKTLTFSGKDDFPYPSLIVDACHCFDNARPKPFAYVILNREMTVAFMVLSHTRDHWVRVTKRDRFKQRDREFYECPIELVEVKRIGTR